MVVLALVLVACSDPYAGADKAPNVDSGSDDAADTGTNDTEHTDNPVDTSTDETGIPDSDGDGWADNEDCVADDEDVYPGAPETWYDGIDSDCAGDSDYDQDQDGYLAADIGGDDCNDLDAATYPGATDVPYDGVDADCVGNDDFDVDQDGERDPSGGGEDCDDTDPDVSPKAVETLDDGIDADCNGDENGFRFSTLDTLGATSLQGPRIASDSSYLMVTFLADSYVDDSTSTTYENGGIQHYFDLLAPQDGSLGAGSWYWGAGYSFHNGFDFVATDDHQTWGYGLQDGAARYLLVDVYDAASGGFTGTGWTFPTTKTFDDVELTEAADGSLHIVGCEDDLGLLTWMHGSPDDFFTNSANIAGDEASGTDSTACIADVENSEVLASDRTRSLFEVFRTSDVAGLSSDGTLGGYDGYDVDVVKSGTHEGWFVAEGPAGVYVELNGDAWQLQAGSADEADAEVSALGTLFVGYAHRDTGAYLAWGAVAPGMPELALDTGLVFVEAIDVALTENGLLLVVARGGEQASWGVVATR